MKISGAYELLACGVDESDPSVLRSAKKSGAPKGTILELFSVISSQI